jgi:hypothetical protein
MTKKRNSIPAALLLSFGLLAHQSNAAAPATPQGMITGKAFSNITGTAVANLTSSPKFPSNPDALFFWPYFEWNATGDIGLPPNDFADNYGSQIVGYFYPPSTGDYVFYIASDDNGALYLSTDDNPANKKLIAQETAYSSAREFGTSAGSSDITAKNSSSFTGTQWPNKDANGLAVITLQGGQPYYIEALAKEGTGGDHLAVAVQDPLGAIDPASPIPGQYLSSDRTNGPVAISLQPQSQTVPERGSVTFSVMADGTPPYTFQWRKNSADILDATNITYTATGLTTADNNAKYSVFVTGGQGTATSQDAVVTVAPDTALPTIQNAKGSPNLTEVVLTFSEPVDQTTATTLANYQLSSSSGPLNITGATLSPSGTQVTLTTVQQTLGTKYTLLVSNVKDTAATPNTIAPNSKAVFFPAGKIVEQNGIIVIEAENYDRNLDGLWERNTARGTPSGGASMVVPNGAGGGESSTKIEYDVEFAQAATYYVWLRASADNGSDDSVWIHIDADGDGTTERPPERDPNVSGAPNLSDSLTGFQPQADFVWSTDSQDGPDPFTIDVPAAGPRAFALAEREDGAFIDKIILTTNSAYTPTGFGPPETRQGAPGLPTVTVTSPTAGQTFGAGANINLASTSAGQSGLEIIRVQYLANGNVIGESTTSPFNFTWTNAPGGTYAIRANAFDEMGQSTTSGSVVITVGSPAPQAIILVGNSSIPTLNPSDAAVKARLESQGWQVTVVQAPVSKTTDADGKQLIVVSSTVSSADVGAKFRDAAVPVVSWEQAVQDDFLMTLNGATDHNTVTGQTQISIVNADHPLAAGLPAGLITVTTNAQDVGYGVPNTNAVIIAAVATDPTQAVIYGYDKGAILIDGTTPAPARRVMFLGSDNSFAAFTPEALQLFDAAVRWASGVQTGPKIAWVSFHSADNNPSANAKTAGFTNAPDIGYTDLLKANNYRVSRIVTSATPDTNLLNSFDLVVISRSVPSGNYQTAASTAAWNGLNAPTMILGGYILRGSRLGFTTGDTIPDTAAPIKLTVNQPAHPIFAGIGLDASNTTTNDYAVIATYTNNLQRGISVNTSPTDGAGTVLATVGTAGDPAAGGMIIGEWQAGDKINTDPTTQTTDTLGGHRLVLLTGSRESATPALNSEGAGIYDLTSDGAKLFLNAVNYMVGGQTAPDKPTLSFTRTQTGLSITFTGTLQSADSLTSGNWTDETTATSPFPVTANQPMKFYRAKR